MGPGVREALETDARARAPAEACGLLLGRSEGARVVAEEARPATNRLNSPVRFEIPPPELYRLWTDAERRGKEVVAIYHSHPAGARAKPSARDAPYLREGGLPWVILSEREVRAFVWDGGVREITLRTARRWTRPGR